MNRKQLITLVVLGLVIGGLGIALYTRRQASWKESDQAMGQKILQDFPLNDIAQIHIKQADAELTLAKVNDLWAVKERWDYPANFSQISELLRKMADLKSVQTLQIGPSQYGRLALLSPEKEKGTNVGTLIEFKDKTGKLVRSLLVGKKATRGSDNASPFGGGDYPVGRYVALPDHPQNVWVISDTLSDLESKPDHWLNKDEFFKVEKLRSIAVTHPNATNSWKITREKEGGDLELADKQPGEEFDKNKAYSAGTALSYPRFDDVVDPAAKPADTGLDQPILAKIETFDHFNYTIKAAKAKGANGENYHLQMTVDASLVKERTPGQDEKPEDKAKLDKEFQDNLKKLEDKLKQEKACEKWTYVVSKWTIDPLLKERKDFLAEKKAEEKKPETTGATPTAEAKPSIPGLEVKPEIPGLEVKPEIKAEVKTEVKAAPPALPASGSDTNAASKPKPAATPPTPPPLPEAKPAE